MAHRQWATYYKYRTNTNKLTVQFIYIYPTVDQVF